MAQGYQLIQSYTLASAASSFTFSNIPQNFTDLKILLSVRASSASGNSNCFIYLNGVTGTSYSQRRLSGNGATAVSDSQTSYPWVDMINAIPNATYTANTFANAEIYIPNYTSSNYKSLSVDFVGENNATTAYAYLDAGLFSSTSAITSITIDGTDNFVQYSTATLYGIGGTRATGGTITADGNYTYHTFTSTGSFIPSEKIRGAEVLLVAGGGSGRGDVGGGGGAGGVTSTAGQTLFAGTSYTALVGAGAAVGATAGSSGNPGSNSSFTSVTAIGGGAGLTSGTSTGGSGGGAYTTNAVGTGTAGQGNNGGTGTASGFYGCGGGGGAGGVGGNGTTTTGGTGGNGTTAYASWHYATSTGISYNGNYYIAGGGGGSGDFRAANSGSGAGGLGGGGAGSLTGSVAGVTGTANTGGGGGGGGYGAPAQFAGAGGSGLVIIRYPNN
jgi:hypothetical protein